MARKAKDHDINDLDNEEDNDYNPDDLGNDKDNL